MDERIDRIVPQVLASERSLTLLLGLLVLAVFVIPVLGLEGADRLYVDVVLSLLLVAGVAAASPDRKTRRFMAGVTLIALVLRWGAWMPGGAPLAAWRELTTLVTELLFSVAILRRVLGAGRVSAHRVRGAIVVYLLLGMSWATAYHLVEYLHPGSFVTQPASSTSLTFNEAVYFSFVTLTTVGFGDITPAHRAARVLAMGEALTGQLYLAVLLARLVSLEIVARTERGTAGDPTR
jgi:ion channel